MRRRQILIILTILSISILISACNGLQGKSQPSNGQSGVDSTNKTVQQTLEQAERGAQFGDLVEINYELRLENGTLADTNNAELARKEGLKTYVGGPYKFILGQSGKVTGFDQVIKGMEVGSHREARIEPTEKEIKIKLNRTQTLPRLVILPLHQKFPVKKYTELFSKPPVIGDVVSSPLLLFKYRVVNKTNESVLAKIIIKEGEKYTLENHQWPSVVLRVSENDAALFQNPKPNMTIETPFGTARVHPLRSRIVLEHEPELNKIFDKTIKINTGFSVPQKFRVTEIDEDTFTIKRHGLLTDKRLLLSVDMLNITKAVKDVKSKIPKQFVSVGPGEEN
ncbi:hypothetical protein D6825_00180 [Candidatus Woesearchaeota archaeon]|nr:MAG: hypothetical protein D6825_00180 [Candidatus Woesearchaeota archaeon]